MDKSEIAKKIVEVKEKSKKRNFKQSVDVTLNFRDIDMESPEYKLNLNVFLPKGRAKDVNIGVFADGDMNVRAKKISGYVLDKSEIDEYAKSRRKMRAFANSCYSFISQPELMSMIGKKWGIILGPRGKMPLPVPVNADLNSVINKLKNSVKIRSKKSLSIHVPVGTEDMSNNDIAENVIAVLNAVERQIPSEKIKSINIKTTMGPIVKLD